MSSHPLRGVLPLLLVVMGVEFATIVDVILVSPLGVGLMRDFGRDQRWFGFLIFSTTFASAACNVFGASRVDRWDRRTVLLVLFTGFGLGELASALAPSAGALLAARVVVGACTGLTASTGMAIVADVVPPERHGSANAVVNLAYAGAFVVGVPASVWLATHTSWRTAFAGLGALVAVLLIAAARVVPSVTGHLAEGTRARRGVLWEVVREGARVRVLTVNGLLLFAAYVVTPLLPPYLVWNLGVQEERLATFYFVGGVVSLVAAVATGLATDRFGAARTLRWLAAISVLPTVWVTTIDHVDVAYVAVAAFMATSTARVVPAVALVMAAVPPSLRGATLSLSSAFQQGSLGMGAIVGAALVTSNAVDGIDGFVACGLVAAGATLASIPLTLGVGRPAPHPVAPR
jgi:predicted MFS family arabinose efflux permease